MNYTVCVGQHEIVGGEEANYQLSVDEVERASVLFNAARVLLCQLDIKQDVTITALRLAKQHNSMYSAFIKIRAKPPLICVL